MMHVSPLKNEVLTIVQSSNRPILINHIADKTTATRHHSRIRKVLDELESVGKVLLVNDGWIFNKKPG